MKTLCKRVPEKQAVVIDFVANKEEENFATMIKRALQASPVFMEFQKLYELSDNVG